MFPGQLPTVRRDLHNVIAPLDLSDSKDIEIIVETLQTFVQRNVPIRMGIVPIVRTEASKKQAIVVHYLQEHYGLGTMMAYLLAVSLSTCFACPMLILADPSRQDLFWVLRSQIQQCHQRSHTEARSRSLGYFESLRGL